ncbi:MAG: 50S ribosomal protein L13 [Alphaproteobacteria bacterium ADurb.Bin438]|nr:MAG: 50S ribosomal protein L13 [Alphaproteobacteria bacterium ADurb.Bin438]
MKKQTISIKPSEVTKKWYLVDAEGLVLGRLASIVSKILRGKHKTIYTPHIDCGDYVVIVNAEKVALTGGNKAEQLTYFKHTGYAGSETFTPAKKVLEGNHPERVIQKAVQRMITRNKLGRAVLTKLKVYQGPNHPHTSQNPEILDIAKMNRKNSRSV